MKKTLAFTAILFAFSLSAIAQKEKGKKEEKEGSSKIKIPAVVTAALLKQYPTSSHVTWEKENGNYEANWGGKEGEDNSIQYSPSGAFIESVVAMPVSGLPATIAAYVKSHYKGAKITEAGKVTDAKGRISYEAEVNKNDLIFDQQGNFIKKG